VVALLVSAGSGIKVPKPRAGMELVPKLRGIFAKRRLEEWLDVIILTLPCGVPYELWTD
jgi:hypothetical protein